MRWRLAIPAVLVLGSLGAGAMGCSGSESDKAGGDKRNSPALLVFAAHDPLYAQHEFAAAVERLSGGSLAVQIRERWRLDDVDYERKLAQDVRAGQADLGIVGARVWDRMGVTAFRGLLAPLLIDDLDLEREVMRGTSATRLVRSLDAAGVVGIALLPGALRRPLGITRALVESEDFDGAKIGMRPGNVADASFRTLGAGSVPWWTGPLAGMDGLELDLVSVADNFYDAPGRTMPTNVVLWPQLQTVFMNRDAFEALKPEQREILRRASREAVKAVLADVESEEKAALAVLCERRRLALVEASSAELLALREALEPVYASLEREPDAKRLIGEVRRLRAKRGPVGSALSCPGGRARAGRDTSTLEGRWRYAPTRQDLLDVGMSPAEAQMLSVPVVFTFAKGRFKIVAGQTVGATGRYTQRGDVVNIVFETGPPLAPPNHVFQLHWSAYRDRLTFSALAGRGPLLYFMARPFTRIR
jgi:TRAP-type C4-dicarboxylate transport system substrate-binding protein